MLASRRLELIVVSHAENILEVSEVEGISQRCSIGNGSESVLEWNGEVEAVRLCGYQERRIL